VLAFQHRLLAGERLPALATTSVGGGF
jgi:hypothetical protein